MASHHGFLNRGKQCLMETILAAVWRGRGRQGSQREPCTEQATIEMEMRLRGAHSEEELAKPGPGWKWQLWRGSQGEWVPGQCALANSRTAREPVAIETEQGGERRVFFLLYYFSVQG